MSPDLAPASEGMLVASEQITLSYLAELVAGTLYGSAERLVHGAAPLYEVGPNELTFLDSASVPEHLESRGIAGVIAKSRIENTELPQIVVSNPRLAFSQIVSLFLPEEAQPVNEISPQSTVDPSAVLGDDVSVAPGVTIGRNVQIGNRCQLMPGVVIMEHSQIGDDCVIFPNVTIYPRTRVGARVTIHAGTVIGAFGFGYTQHQGKHVRTPQLGYVIIEDDVELGACVTVDRGTYGSTRIGEGTKVDNQVMVGHNCQIGRHNLLCSQVGIAGSCKTGDYVVLAGQVGLKDHVSLGDGTIVGAQSGVMDDLDGGQIYLGSPATPQREQMQIMAVQRKLPEMRRTIKELQRIHREGSRISGVQSTNEPNSISSESMPSNSPSNAEQDCPPEDQCAA